MFYNKAIWQNCFPFKKKYFWKNFKNIPTYIKRIHHLIKNGYDDYAVWDTYSWFTTTMRDILKRYNENRMGTPIIIDDYPFDDDSSEESDKMRELNNKKWNEIVERMIFLLGEMDEFTCTRKNPYEDEWWKAEMEFDSKYGMFGQGLMTDTEKEMLKDKGLYTMHTMGELPEYEEISKKHINAENDLEQYRSDCKDEFLELFSKYFYCLWD